MNDSAQWNYYEISVHSDEVDFRTNLFPKWIFVRVERNESNVDLADDLDLYHYLVEIYYSLYICSNISAFIKPQHREVDDTWGDESLPYCE